MDPQSRSVIILKTISGGCQAVCHITEGAENIEYENLQEQLWQDVSARSDEGYAAVRHVLQEVRI